MVAGTRTPEAVWEALSAVSDPEIPVISIVDMNIVSVVEATEERVTVELTPTFAGCPALDLIRREIHSALSALGYEQIEIRTTFTKPWTTDGLSEGTRERLRNFGIAPPPKVEWDLKTTLSKPAACPFCGSDSTHQESAFGPTLCKQIYFCDSCSQSFERFKPI